MERNYVTVTLRYLGPDLQKKILRQSYDYLTIMPNLLSAYDGRRVYKTSYGRRKAVLGTIRLKDRKIAYDSVCELAYEFLREILARRSSLSSVDLTINLR